jgi:hypothetical protein
LSLLVSLARPASTQKNTMSDSNELKPTVPAGTPVPDLIEQYRVRRDAWIAQADELARLRDDVRESAEREAMEIVTAARRDVRQIVMEARRELLVLSAQVQAALGEAGARPDPTALLNRARDNDGGEEEPPHFTETIFAPEEAVKGMLDEARADMDALVEDARTVPFQALAEPPFQALEQPAPILAPILAPPESPSMFSSEPLFGTPPPAPSPVEESSPSLMSAATSRMLLSSPFPSDAVPVPAGNRARVFVGLFGAAGIAVLVGTIWWLRSDRSSASEMAATSTAPATAAPAPAAVSPAASSTPATAPPAVASDTSESSAPLSLLVEARRSSWLRTTVDGESDGGRMLAQGETVRLNAQKNISLRVGDAGAVYVSVNNGQASALGKDGQVITRQFMVENASRGAGATPPEPTAPATPNSSPLSAPPIAAGTPGTPGPTPNPVPLVQPVAAATPSSPPLEPGPPPPSRAETTPAAPAPVARPELPTPGPASPQSAVIAASRQWLDAYHRQDRSTMASLSLDGLQLADERRSEERFPASVDVNRTLDRISVQIAADTAVLTAVMTERSADNGVPPRVSPISQVWELRGNQWRVRQVRLVSEARLNQIFR